MTDAYAKAGVDQGAADSAVAAIVAALAGDPARPAQPPGAAGRALRERDPARRADRHRPLHRRGRDQAAGRRAARPLRHDRDRLRGDERQRRDLRRRRAAGDARLHRDRAGRPRGMRADRGRPGARRRAGRDRDPRRRAGAARRDGPRLRRRRSLLRHGQSGCDRRRLGRAAGGPGDRPTLLGPPLQRLHPRPRRPGWDPARGRPARAPARRDPAGADRDLRQAGARAAALRGRGPRPRPHHLRRARQPGPSCRRSRLRDRRSAPRPSGLRADPGARWGRGRGDARGLQHGLRFLRRRRAGGTRLPRSTSSAAITPTQSGSAERSRWRLARRDR